MTKRTNSKTTLSKLAKKHGYSRKQLAEALGFTHPNYISELGTRMGKVKLETAHKIKVLLGLPNLESLLDLSDEDLIIKNGYIPSDMYIRLKLEFSSYKTKTAKHIQRLEKRNGNSKRD